MTVTPCLTTDREAITFKHLEWCGTRGLRPSTIYQRKRSLFRFRDAVGVDVLEATREQVEVWWLHLAGTAHTRAVELSHVRCYVRWAIRHGLLAEDPCTTIDRPRQRRSHAAAGLAVRR